MFVSGHVGDGENSDVRRKKTSIFNLSSSFQTSGMENNCRRSHGKINFVSLNRWKGNSWRTGFGVLRSVFSQLSAAVSSTLDPVMSR